MGGYGSGQRWDSKDTIEDYKRIDILWMKRNGYLNVGSNGSLRWSRNGEVYSFINFRTSADAIRLLYKTRPQGGEWKDVDYSTPISWDACRFGGERPYFICQGLGCFRRVQHLYGGNPYFVCRHCMNLAYKCQREQWHERASRRADKIRDRAGMDWSYFDCPELFKPKGMHWKTFRKLQREEAHYRHIEINGLVQKFGFNPYKELF